MHARSKSLVSLLALWLTAPVPAFGQAAGAQQTQTQQTQTQQTQTQQTQIRIPANTVVHVTLDEPLSSETAKIGQQITATVSPVDLSGFPTGARFQGIVTEVVRASDKSPGSINARWHAVIMPNPQLVPINGRLYTISPAYTYRDNRGRIYARPYRPDYYDDFYDDYYGFDIEDDDDFDPKWIGYGAAGGAVLGALTGLGFLEGIALGGLGGALYSWIESEDGLPFIGYAPNNDPTVQPASFTPNNQQTTITVYREVTLTAGEPFGIRLTQPVSFIAKESFRYPSKDEAMRDERLVEPRPERFQNVTVVVSGRNVEFKTHRPVSLSGVLYIPLQPVAQAAGMQVHRSPWSRVFVLQTPHGPVQGVLGHRFVIFNDRNGRTRRIGLSVAPITMNGLVYAPAGFISRVTGWRGTWEPAEMRLTLEPRVQAARR